MTTSAATRRVRAIHVPQNSHEPITVRYVDPSCHGLQEQVEGRIECISADAIGIDLWCNDEARIIGMTTNKRATRLAVGLDIFSPRYASLAPLVGPVLIAAVDTEGTTRGITDEHIGPFLTELTNYDDHIDPTVAPHL